MGNFTFKPSKERIKNVAEYTYCKLEDLQEAIHFWRSDLESPTKLSKEDFDEALCNIVKDSQEHFEYFVPDVENKIQSIDVICLLTLLSNVELHIKIDILFEMHCVANNKKLHKQGLLELLINIMRTFRKVFQTPVPSGAEIHAFLEDSIKYFNHKSNANYTHSRKVVSEEKNSSQSNTKNTIPGNEDVDIAANDLWHWSQENKEVSRFLDEILKICIYSKPLLTAAVSGSHTTGIGGNASITTSTNDRTDADNVVDESGEMSTFQMKLKPEEVDIGALLNQLPRSHLWTFTAGDILALNWSLDMVILQPHYSVFQSLEQYTLTGRTAFPVCKHNANKTTTTTTTATGSHQRSTGGGEGYEEGGGVPGSRTRASQSLHPRNIQQLLQQQQQLRPLNLQHGQGYSYFGIVDLVSILCFMAEQCPQSVLYNDDTRNKSSVTAAPFHSPRGGSNPFDTGTTASVNNKYPFSPRGILKGGTTSTYLQQYQRSKVVEDPQLRTTLQYTFSPTGQNSSTTQSQKNSFEELTSSDSGVMLLTDRIPDENLDMSQWKLFGSYFPSASLQEVLECSLDRGLRSRVEDILQIDTYIYSILYQVAKGARTIPISFNRNTPHIAHVVITAEEICSFLVTHCTELIGDLASITVRRSGLLRRPLCLHYTTNLGVAIKAMVMRNVDSAAILDDNDRYIGSIYNTVVGSNPSSASFVYNSDLDMEAHIETLRRQYKQGSYQSSELATTSRSMDLTNFFYMLNLPILECCKMVGIKYREYDQVALPYDIFEERERIPSPVSDENDSCNEGGGGGGIQETAGSNDTSDMKSDGQGIDSSGEASPFIDKSILLHVNAPSPIVHSPLSTGNNNINTPNTNKIGKKYLSGLFSPASPGPALQANSNTTNNGSVHTGTLGTTGNNNTAAGTNATINSKAVGSSSGAQSHLHKRNVTATTTTTSAITPTTPNTPIATTITTATTIAGAAATSTTHTSNNNGNANTPNSSNLTRTNIFRKNRYKVGGRNGQKGGRGYAAKISAEEEKEEKLTNLTAWYYDMKVIQEDDTVLSALHAMAFAGASRTFVVSPFGEVLGSINIFDICAELLRRDSLHQQSS